MSCQKAFHLLFALSICSGCGSADDPVTEEPADDAGISSDAMSPVSDAAFDAAVDAGQGTLKGTAALTYYYVASQSDYSGANDTVLCDAQAKPLATVPRAFADALAIEGTGRLTDGRLLNIAASCSCVSGMRTCYAVLDPVKYPFGQGVGGRALKPYRSIAVDKSFIPYGTRVYVPALSGVQMPGSYGFVHDGCLSADDTGGAIIGAHIDWFVAEKANYRTLDAKLRLSSVAVYTNAPQCP
ncbi:MAG TPA: 3D domain-containing protein [Pseudomonadota bacterium]|nr:3D domain-containing protein [Pseudomonadota bacterium]